MKEQCEFVGFSRRLLFCDTCPQEPPLHGGYSSEGSEAIHDTIVACS
jgi:hypothetical protein